MKRTSCLLLLFFSIISVQCRQDGLSTLASNAAVSPGSFFIGSYVLEGYSVLTEQGHLLTEEDFESVSGTLDIGPFIYHQEISIDEEKTVVTDAYAVGFDEGQPSGTFYAKCASAALPEECVFQPEVITFPFSIEGDVLIFRIPGTTDLGIQYEEIFRWRKVSNVPN